MTHLDGDAPQTSVAITNTFDVGALTIAKVVDGTAVSSVTRTFPVDVRCVLVDASHPDPGIVLHDATYRIGGPDRLSASIENLPVGSVCDVVETDAGGANQTVVSVDGARSAGTSTTVTVATGGTAIVFTNTFIAPLPPTGAVFGWVTLALALALVLGGLVLVGLTRRRRREV